MLSRAQTIILVRQSEQNAWGDADNGMNFGVLGSAYWWFWWKSQVNEFVNLEFFN